MNLRFTDRADKDYANLPGAVRKALAKQLRFLLENRNHPSLQTKKYDEANRFLRFADNSVILRESKHEDLAC